MEVLDLGHNLIVVAAVVVAAIFLFSLTGILRRDRRFVRGSRYGFYALFVILTCASVCLAHGFVAGLYNNEYMYNYSEKNLVTFFKLAGLWAGLDGSLLFWLWILSIFSAVAALQHRWSSKHPTGRRMEPWVYVVLSVILGFFVAICLAENVFESMPLDKRLRLAQAHGVGMDSGGNLLDGHGLNPQLVNYWFVIHPPTLYVGFIGMTIPFAFTLAALFVGEIGNYWVRIVRRWTMVAWIFLTSGIVLGGLWAYRQLGWGGYWAWDPVENASLLPWLTGTAFLHSIMIQERRDMLKGWNVFLIQLTFFLTIMGTWMTRSGVVQSVHAFAGGSVGIWFQVFMFVVAASSVLLLTFRRRSLRGTQSLESILSREAAFYINNWVLLALAFMVFFFSFLPKISHDWMAKPKSNLNWFEISTTPLFALLLFLTAVGPGLGWVKTSWKSLRRNFFGSALATAIFTGLLYLFFWYAGMLGTWKEVLLPRFFHIEGLQFWNFRDLFDHFHDLLLWQHPTAFYPTGLFLGLAFFVFATVTSELLRSLRARVRLRHENAVQAFVNIVVRNNRRWGGYTVHIGLAIMAVGIISSSMFKLKQEVGLKPGESTLIGPYRVALVDAKLRQTVTAGEPYWKDEITFRVTRPETGSLPVAHGASAAGEAPGGESLVTVLRPEGRYYPKQQIWINEVSIHRMLLKDIYIYAARTGNSSAGGEDGFSLTIFVNPLMLLIYIGWIVIVLGALYAALPVPGSRVGLAE